MNMQHDLAEDEGADEAVDDLSTLAWVHDELRRSLETAHKALRRYLKEAGAGSGSVSDGKGSGMCGVGSGGAGGSTGSSSAT